MFASMQHRGCPARFNVSPLFWLKLKESSMKTSARLSLLAAAMAVGGLFAAPAQALTATAQPALLNPGQAIAKPVEQVGYYRYYHRPYYRRYYHRRYYRPYGYYRPYYRSYAYSPYYYNDYYPYGYGYGYPYGYGYGYGAPVVGLGIGLGGFGWGWGGGHWGGGHWGGGHWGGHWRH
jgi:hypothetical protein